MTRAARWKLGAGLGSVRRALAAGVTLLQTTKDTKIHGCAQQHDVFTALHKDWISRVIVVDPDEHWLL